MLSCNSSHPQSSSCQLCHKGFQPAWASDFCDSLVGLSWDLLKCQEASGWCSIHSKSRHVSPSTAKHSQQNHRQVNFTMHFLSGALSFGSAWQLSCSLVGRARPYVQYQVQPSQLWEHAAWQVSRGQLSASEVAWVQLQEQQDDRGWTRRCRESAS